MYRVATPTNPVGNDKYSHRRTPHREGQNDHRRRHRPRRPRRGRLRRRVGLQGLLLRRELRGSGASKLSLVAYSTPQVVYDEVVPAFEKTSAGKGTTFSQSYGASGEQSRAVEGGLPADVVAFSLAPDVDRLVKADLVSSDWAKTPTNGFVSKSVVVFITRKGNPKHVKTWSDLLKPGVQVVTPNPFTSGAAKWNLLAGYGKQKDLGYLQKLIKDHVKVQPKSGREALQTFTSGTGDVLLSYENEAITAQKKGQDVDYTIPDQTILIENPIAVVDEVQVADAGEGLRGLRGVQARPGGLRRLGLPPGAPLRAGRAPEPLPDAERPVHHPRHRRLGPDQRRPLRPGHRRGGQDRAERGGLH